MCFRDVDDIRNVGLRQLTNMYMSPPTRVEGHIDFVMDVCPPIHPSVCLSAHKFMSAP